VKQKDNEDNKEQSQGKTGRRPPKRENIHLKNFNRKLPRNKYIYKYIYIPSKPKKNVHTLIEYIDIYIYIERRNMLYLL